MEERRADDRRTDVRPRRRRRPTRREFMVRRAVVGGGLVVVLVVVGLGVRSVLGGASGDDATDVSTPDTGRSEVTTGTGGGSDGGGEGVAGTPTSAATTSTTTSSTTTTTQPAGPPSAENPAKVLVVGDSDAGTFGPYLKTLLDDTGVATTEVDYIVSSGLARPDFYDWPSYLREILPEADPDIVVVTFGGNDAQALSLVDGTFPAEWNDPVSDDAAWTTEYARRAGEVMDLLLEGGRTVIWVGIPNDDNPEVTERMAVQDEAAKAAAAERPAITFVDTWARFSGRSGNWAEFVVDPRDGVGKDVRAEDGFHLNENGAEILALDIANVVRADLVERGARL